MATAGGTSRLRCLAPPRGTASRHHLGTASRHRLAAPPRGTMTTTSRHRFAAQPPVLAAPPHRSSWYYLAVPLRGTSFSFHNYHCVKPLPPTQGLATRLFDFHPVCPVLFRVKGVKVSSHPEKRLCMGGCGPGRAPPRLEARPDAAPGDDRARAVQPQLRRVPQHARGPGPGPDRPADAARAPPCPAPRAPKRATASWRRSCDPVFSRPDLSASRTNPKSASAPADIRRQARNVGAFLCITLGSPNRPFLCECEV